MANKILTDPEQPSTIEEWVSLKDPFRVVANGLPMAFPSQRSNGNPELRNIYETRVKPLVAQVLTQHGISSMVQNLDFWFPPHEKSKGQEIFVVDTNDTNTSSWALAANAILALFAANGARNVVAHMQVEIRNPTEMYYDVSRLLPANQALLQALSQIREQILDTVSASLGGAWFSIAYHMRVDRRNVLNAPRKPSVLVFCRPRSTCRFEVAEDRLMQILDKVPFQVHLEILSGDIILAEGLTDGNPMLLEGITQKPLNGASISFQGKTDDAGALGGWVTLNLPKQKKSVKCGLTCYHVIRSGDKNITDYTDDNGISTKDPRGQVIVEYPAAYDANHTMKALNNFLQNNQSKVHESDRAILTSLMANPGIGQVILSSGYGLRENSRLDWALIESPDTFSANKPPPLSAFIGSIFTRPSSPVLYSQNADSKVRNFGQVKLGEWVAKRGRTSLTSGMINNMKRDVQWVSGRMTTEVEILSEDGPFVQPGDSGSFVTNVHGELLGLIFAKDVMAGNHDIGLMTPMAAIQKHVREMTDGGFLSLD
jgi:hypothetical protein